MPQNEGKVVQIIGPIIDVEFLPNKLPAIYNAVKVVGSYKNAEGETFRVDLPSIS